MKPSIRIRGYIALIALYMSWGARRGHCQDVLFAQIYSYRAVDLEGAILTDKTLDLLLILTQFECDWWPDIVRASSRYGTGYQIGRVY